MCLYSIHDDVFLQTCGPYPGYNLAEQLNEQFISALSAPRRLIVSDDVREGKNGFEANREILPLLTSAPPQANTFYLVYNYNSTAFVFFQPDYVLNLDFYHRENLFGGHFMPQVEQNYKERATSIDRWGRYTSVEVPYIVFEVEDEDAALTAVLNAVPKTLHNLPLDAIEIDSREGDTTFKVNATYKAEFSTESYGDEEEDEESTISFDCGAGTKHVSFAIDQRIAYGTIAAGGAIGWNGKHGAEMEIAGVDVPTAELRETHTKTMRVTKLTNDFIRKVAGFVGKVNSKTFNGWHPGEAMFLGMSYSRAKSAKHVSVTFHFSIQLNESNATLCGHSLGSKKGFEYISAIPKTSVDEDVPSVDIEAAHISQVVLYGDFGELGV